MTSFLLSFPGIPNDALTITPSATTDDDMPERNLTNGPRSTYFKLATTGTGLSFTFDLGTGNTQAVDHLIIARADLLKTGGVTTVTLSRSSDDISYGNEHNDTSFASATLLGPNSDDYVASISTSSAYRYWKLTYADGGAWNYIHSKVYFGQWFDFAQEPSEYSIKRDLPQSVFRSDSSVEYGQSIGEPKYNIQLFWNGISKAKLDSFLAKAEASLKTGLFLYTASNHDILLNERVIHCEILQVSHEPLANGWHNLFLEVREMVG